MKYCDNPYFWNRRITREVKVGSVGVGGAHPIRVQTMLISDTMDTDACIQEAIPIIEAGCEILRITAPSINDARNLENIVQCLRSRGFDTPIVADIHFVPAAALEAAQWCEKVRINPGNFADRKKFAIREYSDDQYTEELDRLEQAFSPLVLRCKELGRAMRIGTNHGSLSDRIMNRYGDTPLGMVESALEFVRICRRHNYHEIILSMKASNPKVMIEAYRLLVGRLMEEGEDWNYPLHLGVTEAGEGEDGRIKSAIGIGSLLEDGIGDTVRVSLTEDSVHEIPVCKALVSKYNARWSKRQAEQGKSRPQLDITEIRNPYSYTKRSTPEMVAGGLRIGAMHPPRVELSLPINSSVQEIKQITTAEADTFAELLKFKVQSIEDLAPLALLREALRKQNIFTPFTLELSPSNTLTILEHPQFAADKINISFDGTNDLLPILRQAKDIIIQIDINAQSPLKLVEHSKNILQLLHSYRSSQIILSIAQANGIDPIGAYRILAATIDEGSKIKYPILLRNDLSKNYADQADLDTLLQASSRIGSLLADGIGDAIEIVGILDSLQRIKLAYNILQAVGARIFKTDYVACPSCGRTLFNLQKVTARIKSRTVHLKGVRIAVMGCIVNGPGEMADADFGYVGTAPGKISLWVGKTQVKQHIPEEQAVDELINLIKEHGKWVDPISKNEITTIEPALTVTTS